jgi:hypothetical protein
MDSDSEWYIEDKAGSMHDRSCEDDEKPQHPSRPLRGPPQQHGKRGVNNKSGGAVRIYISLKLHT